MTWQDNVTPELQRIIAELERMKRVKIIVGVLGSAGSHMQMLASVHEYGATIRPRNTKNLAIPLKPEARNKNPREWKNTWIYDNGEHAFIVQSLPGEGKTKKLDFLYLLLPSVTIPERSFIRAGLDASKDKLLAVYDDAMLRLVNGEYTADTVAHRIGRAAVTFIQEFMPTVQPPKSNVTLASNPDATQTLTDTGQLSEHIEYEVIGL